MSTRGIGYGGARQVGLRDSPPHSRPPWIRTHWCRNTARRRDYPPSKLPPTCDRKGSPPPTQSRQVYGGRELRSGIRQRKMGYVLAVRANHSVTVGSGRTVTAAELGGLRHCTAPVVREGGKAGVVQRIGWPGACLSLGLSRYVQLRQLVADTRDRPSPRLWIDAVF